MPKKASTPRSLPPGKTEPKDRKDFSGRDRIMTLPTMREGFRSQVVHARCLRSVLEAAVKAKRGLISIEEAAIINLAARAELAARLADALCTGQPEATQNQLLDWQDKALKATKDRNKAIKQLELGDVLTEDDAGYAIAEFYRTVEEEPDGGDCDDRDRSVTEP